MIRLATPADAAAVAAIYGPFVAGTPISFELDPPGAEEMARRICDTLAWLPWLVCERDGAIAGYAYASKHRDRAAYQWAVDVSVYVADRFRRQGVARALYEDLFARLRRQGYVLAHAGIALPNPGSVGLHEALGFERVGVFKQVGHKLGKWHDVGWWQLALGPRPLLPAPPMPPTARIGS